jgi:hypothetical protein
MTTLAPRSVSWLARLIIFVALCGAGISAAQPLDRLGTQPPPVLVMVARVDPANADRYFPIIGDEVANAVAMSRLGQRFQISVPFYLERGDEIETAANVVAVLRYPIGDVYVGGGTRVRIGSLDVFFGRVFARVRGLFSVESQNVVAGVEGTEFEFEVERNGNAEITVVDGAVLCASRRVPWRPVRVTRNLAFEVSSGGAEFRVGQASASKLAQLHRWVRSVEVVTPPPTAPVQPPPPVPPPPTPAPPPPISTPPAPSPPFQPVPIPIPIPVPTPQPPPAPAFWGYCCEGGRVVNTTADACRGAFYRSQSAAHAQCRQMTGYCCANGRVYASAPGGCQGKFYADERSALRSCAAPPPPQPFGYCCSNGQISRTAQNQCRGAYFTDEASARHGCAPPPQQGYCCAAGRVVQASRDTCRGTFYNDLPSAQRSCTPPPEQGYCCAGGKVSAAARDRCTGSFHRSQQEAQNACTKIYSAPLRKGMVEKVPTIPKSDAPR